ncbi:unnamed protein product [Rangifer tarandus platyrhynchus]|uniref:Uncharacterized protein n=2 Tax=Rangifer tarandus platyrhynchus TaxID=3082113 RepID=A0AC59Z6W4_RANTA|nr:unnamed protein product [Rangifer tarandus platyrhynchus]
MVALNVGSMPGPAPPQFPGHSLPSSSLKGWGPRSQEAHPWLRPLVWSPCPFCDQNRAWTTSAWAGDSMGQRGQRGTEGTAWDRGDSVGQRHAPQETQALAEPQYRPALHVPAAFGEGKKQRGQGEAWSGVQGSG